MNIIKEYYEKKYIELCVLADTEKCKTTLMRNKDTGQLVVKKIMNKAAFDVYNQLKHITNKNLVKIFDCYIDEDKCIEIEDFINGRRLDDYVNNQKLDYNSCIRLTVDICMALEELHKIGIVHRDIQPKNILISNEGTLKLIDFDISRKQHIGKNKDTELLGTAGYAAPEQYGFSQTSEKSDIYSIGIVLEEMCEKGNIPADGKLKDIIDKCTQMDPDNRFQNVEQLKDALLQCWSVENEGSTHMYDFENGADLQNNYQMSDNVEKLSPITFKYVIKTIPGFKSNNFFYAIISILIYGFMIYAFASVPFDKDYAHASMYNKVIASALAIADVVIPYMYWTNIADIAKRFPKKSFKSQWMQYIYQAIVGTFVMLAIALLIVVILR